MSTRLPISPLFIIVALAILLFSQLAHAQSWNNHSRDSQHTALSSVASQPLNAVRWQTPVDLNPQYSGNDLLIHYGSSLVTQANTVIVPVKTGASGGFRVEGINGANGTIKWTQTTDYVLPPHDWVPSYSPALAPGNKLYFAAAGTGSWVAASTAANDGVITKVIHNAAPALSNDGLSLYVAVSNGSGTGFGTRGYLVRLQSSNLQTLAAVRLKDVKISTNDA